MTCVCRGQSLVIKRHGHEGPTPRVNHLRPTVFVDAIPELASERSRLPATVTASSMFTLRFGVRRVR